MARSRDRDAILAASEAAIALILERGNLKVTVAELAKAAGTPERTFYRWFGTKELALRPVFDWGTDVFARHLEDAVDETGTSETRTGTHEAGTSNTRTKSIHDALTAAFEEVLWGPLEARTRTLFPLVFAEPSAQAVFFFAIHDGEHRILAPLARHLGTTPDDPKVRAVAGAAVASLRVALEDMARDGSDPRPRYAEMLDAFGVPRSVHPSPSSTGDPAGNGTPDTPPQP